MPCRRREILEGLEHRGRNDKQYGANNEPLMRKNIPKLDKVLILVFNTGKCVITGAKNYSGSIGMAHQFCSLLNKTTGMQAVVTDFRICNYVARCELPHTINLEDMFENSMLRTQLKYDPNEFKMLIVRSSSYFDSSLPQEDRNIAALIGKGGAMNLTGPKSLAQIRNFSRDIYQHIKYFQPGAGPPPWIRPPVREMNMVGIGYSRTVHFDSITNGEEEEESDANTDDIIMSWVSSRKDYGIDDGDEEQEEQQHAPPPRPQTSTSQTKPTTTITDLPPKSSAGPKITISEEEDNILTEFNSLSLDTMRQMDHDELEQLYAQEKNLVDYLSNLNISELHNPDVGGSSSNS
jgi:TATA-box binding protein (TBP) (component of TFIID and TFIIIB)